MSRAMIVFEDGGWSRFLPLVYTRGVFELRSGQGLLWQRCARLWKQGGGASPRIGFWCRPNLSAVVAEQVPGPVNEPLTGASLLVNGRGYWKRLPEPDDASRSWVGTAGDPDRIACVMADPELAARLAPEVFLDPGLLDATLQGIPRKDVTALVELFDWPWEIVHANARAIESDWELPQGRDQRASGSEDFPGVYRLNPESIHIGASSRVQPCVVIDAEHGPVWIGERVTIRPHVSIEGPVVIGDDCLIQPGAVIREGTTLGPRCKVGGEVEASILQGFTNKQHDGFLGHSYVGSWVNIGADCLNSDLKNTYGTIRVPINGQEVDTGQLFVGLLMGDHSKTGINVAFPTGAVVGFCSSVVCSQAPKFVPSFTWHETEGSSPFAIEKGLAIARRMMSRRGQELTAAGEALFRQTQALAGELETTA